MSQLTSIAPTDSAFAGQDWTGAVRLTFRPDEEIYAQDEDADLTTCLSPASRWPRWRKVNP